MLNYLLVFLIIFSFVAYVYFKYRQSRTTYRLPIRKKMYASQAGAGLGAMLFFFGINQIILFDGAVTYIVSILFILLGAYVFIFNFKAHKHYKQFIEEEAILNGQS